MRSECIDAVRQAGIDKLGRSITAQELKGIEDRVRGAMKDLASDDPEGWQAKPTGQRMQEAAERAAIDLENEALQKKFRVADTIKAHDTIENYMASQKQ